MDGEENNEKRQLMRKEKDGILIHQRSHMSISSMSTDIELDGITKGHESAF